MSVVKGRIDRGGIRERENILIFMSHNLTIKVTWERKKRKQKKRNLFYCLLEVVANYSGNIW